METVTVRMARGDRNQPWGFGVTEAPNRDVVIVNIVGGSLAERAGLRAGDIVFELEGLRDLDINAVDRLLVTSREKIELAVTRAAGGQARLWRPEITENQDMRAVFSGNPPPVDQRPYKVSLEHHSDMRAPQGFNNAAIPFDADPRVKHLQYNSPMGLYSSQNVEESYRQQTAGITGQNAGSGSGQQPGYLQSETLRLIKEQDNRGGATSTLSSHPNPSGLPVCFVCTRPILGVMAKAAGQTIHGDCLSCATCGNSLRNVGHHFIENKFYCEIHGRQKKGLGPIQMDPNLAVRSSPTAAQPVRREEGVRGFYQPEILGRRPVSPGVTQINSNHSQVNVHVSNPKTQGPISPHNRGVPTNPNLGPSGGSYASYGSDQHLRPVSPRPVPVISVPAPPPPQVQAPPPPPPSNPPPGSQQQNFSRSTFEKTATTTTNGMANGHATGGRSGAVSSHNTASYGGRIPYCEACKQQIKGAFVLATGLAWCPEHFVCANRSCGRRLLECGFVEENGQKYCEGCFESHIAPRCAKCAKPITSDCLNALHKKWHPTCFTCAHCHKPFGNSAFYLENGQPYCEQDWNQLFTTKCVSCKYPIEAGDRWVEALGSAFHSNCFNCSRCHTNLEGESFYAKNGQPFCKMHA
jgi:hypothetical protein